MRRKAPAFILGLLVSWLVAGPTFASAPPPEKTDSEKLDEIARQLKALAENVKEVNVRLGDLSLSTNRTIADLKSRIDDLEKRLGMVEGSGDGVRRSFAPPVVGTIRLMNRSAFGATVFLNGRPYSVTPGERRDLTGQAAGAFTYSVDADGFGMIQPQVSRTLGADRIFTIFINP